MDNIAYLNQISAENRASKTNSNGLFSPKLMIILGAIVLITIIIIVGGSLSSGSEKGVDLVSQISLRSVNLSKTISTYNKQTKSSELRSIASSLSSILTETSSKTTELLSSVYGLKNGKISEKITEKETAYIENVDAELEKARLNGLLDRNYVRILTLQTGLLMSLESECLSRTNNSDVKNVLSNSYANLASIYETLSNYSDSTS